MQQKKPLLVEERFFYCIIFFMKNRLAGNIALFLTALIWGLGFVAQRAGMEFIGPFTFNTVRSFLGALSLIPLILWVKYSKPDTRTQKRKVPKEKRSTLLCCWQ